MAKLAMLLPNEEMFRQTHDVLQEMRLRVDFIKMIETKNAVTEARQAMNQGAEIIIARGLQASIIKQHTDIPVVEITLTQNGVRDMLHRAKRILKKSCPEIAFVMFKNMSCDMSGLEEEMQVHIREYYVQNPELLQAAAVQAVEDRADLMIGGATALEVADAAGVPSLFLSNTEDAIAAAIREAVQLSRSFAKSSVFLPGEKLPSSAFVQFPYRSQKMAELIEAAKRLSTADCPKLLLEPVGTLYHALARAIHNHSAHSRDQLLIYDCVEGESAYETLFGQRGMLTRSGKGSFQINEIEYLDRRSQRKLLEMLLFRHVIAVTKKEDLKNYLLPELYERLRPFCLEIPPLRECREDISLLLSAHMMGLTEKYGKYHVLSKEAEQFLLIQKWRGNRIQLESFLERLLLCAEHRSIGKAETEALYQSLYPEEGEAWESIEKEDAFYSEKEEIVKALKLSFGNREKTAERLGISTTTLWRKLKKYGIR